MLAPVARSTARLSAEEGTTERVIGLVEVPAVFGPGGEYDPQRRVEPVSLHARSSEEAPVVAVVRSRSQIASREHGYEVASAEVYEHVPWNNGTWNRVKFVDGEREIFGWLLPKDAGRYRSIYELLASGLSHLTADWDRKLYRLPDRSSLSTTYSEDDLFFGTNDVRLADQDIDANGDLWFLVVLVRGNVCDGGGKEILATGWIPAHAENGRTTAWFYSRGC